MKVAGILIFIGLCSVVYSRPQEKYTTKYDNVDLDAIIKNDRLLRNYIDCVLGKKKCTNDGLVLKEHLTDALETDCAKCSEVQRNGSRKVIMHLIKNKREWWNEVQARFDPDRKYITKHAEELKAAGISL